MYFIKKTLVFTLFIFLSIVTIYSQEYSTRLYTTKDGLKQIQVTSVIQTPDGLIWAGTHGGLSCFDGLEFKNFTEKDGLSSNLVYTLGYWDDTLYVQTRDGIDIITKGVISNLIRDDTLKMNVGYFLLNDQRHLFAVNGYYGSILIDLKKKSVWHFPKFLESKEGFPNLTENFALIGKDYDLYKVFYGDTAAVKLFSFKEKIKSVSIVNETVYIGLEPKAATNYYSDIKKYIIDDTTLIQQPFNFKSLRLKQNEIIYSFLPTRDGETFLSTYLGDIIYIDSKGRATRYINNYNLINGSIEDRDGNIWFATEKGLLKLFKNGFLYYTPQQGYPENIWASAEINDSILLMSSYNNGIHIYNNNKEIKTDDSEADYLACYMGACFGFDNDIVVSSYPGVTRYVLSGNKLITLYDKMEEPTLTIYKDTISNRILVGNLRALIGLDSSYYADTILNLPDIKNYFTIIAIATLEDDIFLGLSKGLLKYNTKTGSVTYLNKEERFNSIVIDSCNNLWGGTQEGLIYYTEDTSFFIKGLNKGGEITSLIIDDKHHLLVSGLDDLYIINLDLFYKKRNNFLKYFNWCDGYNGNSPQQNAFFKTKKGDLLLPTANNVIRIIPDNLKNPSKSLLTKIYAVSVSRGDTNFTAVDTGKEIIIPPTLNNLKLKFKSINQVNPERTQYQYLLVNDNKTWSGVQKSRELNFNNLPPGHYTFSVKASTDHDFSKAEADVVNFTILPPFWQTAWFITLSILLFTVIIVFITLQLKKKEQKKNKIKLELSKLKNIALSTQIDHHFLANCTSKIVILYESGKTEEANRYTRTFSDFLRRNLMYLRADKISLKEELRLVEQYVELERRYGKDFDFKIVVDQNINLEKIMIFPFLIQPIVENAIKHGVKKLNSGDGKIYITVQKTGNYVKIIIHDNGPGLNNNQIATGNGTSLKIVKERLALFGKGSGIEVESNHNGTTVTITILNV